MITRETVLAAFEKRLADDPLVSAEWHAFARADLAATLAKSGRAPDEAVRAFADKREGQCGGLALNAAPRRRSKTSWRVGN
jgi:hypothetical protein